MTYESDLQTSNKRYAHQTKDIHRQGDLRKGPTKKSYKSHLLPFYKRQTKDTHPQRDLRKRPTKESYKSDLYKNPTNEPFEKCHFCRSSFGWCGNIKPENNRSLVWVYFWIYRSLLIMLVCLSANLRRTLQIIFWHTRIFIYIYIYIYIKYLSILCIYLRWWQLGLFHSALSYL